MDVNSFRFGPTLKNLSSPSNPAYDFGTKPFSVEAWVKTLTGGPVVGRKTKDTGVGHGGFLLSVNPRKISLTSYDKSTSHSLLATNISVCDGRWHHIAAVRSGASGSIYLDGVSCAITTEGDGTPPLNVDSTDRLTIGTVDRDASFFAGYLAEIRLWNVARTSDDVSKNFHRRLNPTEMTSGPVGYWSGEFGVAADFSKIRNTTSINGKNRGASTCPPIIRSSPFDLCLIFCGIYDCVTKAQNSNDWTPHARFIVTSQGFVVSVSNGDSAVTIINKVGVDGAQLSWPVDGNPFGASIRFVSQGSAKYWNDQPHRPVFEGTAKFSGRNEQVLYRGVIEFVRIGSGILLNVGTSQFVTCTNPEVGTPVTLRVASEDAQSVQSRDVFGRYDIGGIIHADSNFALKPVKPAAGEKVLLTSPTLGGAHQSWSMVTGGRILFKGDPTLALSAGAAGSDGVRSVIVDTANPTDLKQKWLSLENGQYVWNGSASNAVLASVGPDAVGVRAKADGSPGQLWYTFGSSFICASSAKALTTTGVIVGSELKLQPWIPDNSNQQFTYVNGEIIHDATGLILSMQGDLANGKVILADSSADSKESRWSILTGFPPRVAAPNTTKLVTLPWTGNGSSRLRREARETDTLSTSALGDFTCGLTAAGLTSYVISITTADVYLAGTDNIVKISLENRIKEESLPFVELNNSLTHPEDPFERGNKDVFVLANMKDIGQITGVTFEITKLHWYTMNGGWSMTGITVVNTKWHTTSLFLAQQLENLATLDMPYKISLPMLLAPGEKYECTMRLGIAPAQDAIGMKFGWDHTWIEVINRTGDKKTTFFDCAGGHGGPGTKRVDMGICNRNDVVKMSTGNPIDDSRPLQDTYGTNLTNGVGNANVRCDGKVKWDGQCHQIANRYLWTCIPSTSIDDLPYDQQPHGYGLSVLFFGKYGIGFAKWCLDNGFGYVETDDQLHFFYWWQKLGYSIDKGKAVHAFITEKKLWEKIANLEISDAIKVLVKGLKDEFGMNAEQIAKLTNLTNQEVGEYLEGTGGWFRIFG